MTPVWGTARAAQAESHPHVGPMSPSSITQLLGCTSKDCHHRGPDEEIPARLGTDPCGCAQTCCECWERWSRRSSAPARHAASPVPRRSPASSSSGLPRDWLSTGSTQLAESHLPSLILLAGQECKAHLSSWDIPRVTNPDTALP